MAETTTGSVEGDAPGPPPGRSIRVRKAKGKGRSSWFEWIAILVAAVLVAVILHIFFVQAYYIPSGSMEPTLKVGNRVLVNKISYDLHGVHRGDIVVFKKPADVNMPGINDLIKRVIGLPGERIASGPHGQVLINGKPIKQSWLTAQARANPGINITPQTIPKGDYFMMGDNRSNSEDSRYIGPIPGKLIVGRAFVRVWPLGSIGGL